MVIKALLVHAGLLGMRTITYLLTNHTLIFLIIYTMGEKGEIVKEVYENNFGTAYVTYNISVQKIA